MMTMYKTSGPGNFPEPMSSNYIEI